MDSAVPIADRTDLECSDRTGTITFFGNFAGKSAAARVNANGFESAHADLRPRYRYSQRRAAGGHGSLAA